MRKLTTYFIKGLLFLLPILLVITLVRELFSIVLPTGVGFISGVTTLGIAILITTLVGAVITGGLQPYFKRRALRGLGKFPFLNQIFTSMKRFVLILNFSREIFENPVIVTREEGREIKFGFVTRSGLEQFGLSQHSSVYLPDPFSFLGEMVVVANKDLRPVEGKRSEVSNFILSGGLVQK
ncbi:MAG: DUF502 domain-containing protein [Candidatus Saccharimonadales bacterium]